MSQLGLKSVLLVLIAGIVLCFGPGLVAMLRLEVLPGLVIGLGCFVVLAVGLAHRQPEVSRLFWGGLLLCWAASVNMDASVLTWAVTWGLAGAGALLARTAAVRLSWICHERRWQRSQG